MWLTPSVFECGFEETVVHLRNAQVIESKACTTYVVCMWMHICRFTLCTSSVCRLKEHRSVPVVCIVGARIMYVERL